MHLLFVFSQSDWIVNQPVVVAKTKRIIGYYYMYKLNHIFLSLFCTFCLAVCSQSFAQTSEPPAVTIIKSNSIALRGEAKYPADFKHWGYVNPKAPKGGALVLATQGTFDNFNRYAQRGNSPAGIEGLFDSLMTANSDELQVMYGLIAEKIEYPSDYSWIIFHINPKAKFQDGKPITAKDVAFSFNLFYTQGVSQFKKYYQDVKVEVISTHQVKFVLPRKDKSLLFNLTDLTIFPEYFYKDKPFAEPFNTPPLGSGPYKIADFKMGKYVTYQLNKDYWAINHPANIGRMNFEFERIEYYLDETVLMEAFKKGEYDMRLENSSKNWATQYVGDNFDKKYIVKEEIEHQLPSGNQAFVFNIKRPQFADRHVRMALNLLLDFEWTNKNLFYGSYKRNFSYFMNTEYASSGIPSGEELAVLNQFKDELPSELFTQEFKLNKTDGSGQIRNEMRQALNLFKQAGYQLKDKKLVDKNGKQFEFEVLLYSQTMERVVIPFQENVAKIGAKLNIRLLSDVSQYTNRLRERDFDMLVSALGGGGIPSSALKMEWHSNFLESTYNSVGTQDKKLDYLVEKIEKHENDNEKLKVYARALDRVLLWSYYTIPQWHNSSHRVAYWDKISRPKVMPKYALGTDTWWYDAAKAKKLPDFKAPASQ